MTKEITKAPTKEVAKKGDERNFAILMERTSDLTRKKIKCGGKGCIGGKRRW